MKQARSLQPQDQIAHYTIVSPLAAGGMGEVYLAQDRTLERSVALKILPPELTRSEERVRRFIREAKSASSLNHPNIVTIYEIGQESIRSAGRDAPSGADSTSVHYISMELVSGETLGSKVHDASIDLRTLLGYLAQAAEGLAKAHAAGIVHRDLKPSNIMVSKDGFTKILDFGLAKLTERGAPEGDATAGATEAEEGTRAGVVLGTVGYMSPEQVQGKTVDHRSDIFSFGAILYEAATRTKPFTADSDVETMHKILHDKPRPVEELNARVPAEVRRLIRRCLAKNPEQRIQSAKDLALELREIVDEYDSLSTSGTSAAPALGAAPATRRWSRRNALLIAGAILVGAAGIALGVWSLRQRSAGSNEAFQRMRITSVTNVGDVRDAALSPDGRYLAYVNGPTGHRNVTVRQVATGSDVVILADQSNEPRGLRFSGDGNYLFYLGRDPDTPNYSALFQVPSLGGTPTKRLFDVDSGVSFSPDGKRICFVRGVPQATASLLVIADLDSGRERIVARTERGDIMLTNSCSWSPDGDRIAVVQVATGGVQRPVPRAVVHRVKDGGTVELPPGGWPVVQDLVWLPGGKGLLIAGLDLTGAPVSQVGMLRLPEGKWRRITNDLNSYATLSAAADGSAVAAIRNQATGNIWTASPDGEHDAHPLTSSTTSDNAIQVFVPADNGEVLFVASRDQRPNIFSILPGAGEAKSLTSGKGFITNVRTAGNAIFFNRFGESDLIARLYRADLDGGNERPLVDFPNSNLLAVSPDGAQVLFSRSDRPREVWIVSGSGGEARILAAGQAGSLGFSPDGSKVAVSDLKEEGGRQRPVWRILPKSGGEPIATVEAPPGVATLKWSPDGNGVTFVRFGRDTAAVYRMGLGAVPPKALFRWTHGGIVDYAFSPDGRRVILTCLDGQQPNIWVADADGRNPARVTDFKTGNLYGITWSRDGKRILFGYGESSSDVVLIRDFQ